MSGCGKMQLIPVRGWDTSAGQRREPSSCPSPPPQAGCTGALERKRKPLGMGEGSDLPKRKYLDPGTGRTNCRESKSEISPLTLQKLSHQEYRGDLFTLSRSHGDPLGDTAGGRGWGAESQCLSPPSPPHPHPSEKVATASSLGNVKWPLWPPAYAQGLGSIYK